MAAYILARAGIKVTLFEKRKAPGRKLLIAGSSGLNVSYDGEPSELASHYRGPHSHFGEVFRVFSREDWLSFIASLGLETFKGTSRRYFVREMKASGLLKAWTDQLRALGVEFEFSCELTDFGDGFVEFNRGAKKNFSAVGFFLGGGSWEPEETPLRWPKIFSDKGIRFMDFQASNSGFEVAWPEKFLQEAEGKPLKSIELTTSQGRRKGELMVTAYGLEGTPVYAIGETGEVYLDLKPDLSAVEITTKLLADKKENLSPMRRIKKDLKLCEASLALLFHLTIPAQKNDLSAMIKAIKRFPLRLGDRRPLQESISSSGGLDFSELTQELMLNRFPGFFAGGEMLNWDAPTGGFLIQASVSQGAFVAKGILDYLKRTARG
jgi:uncharacterized flavoprotein (TIGR03862 family)